MPKLIGDALASDQGGVTDAAPGLVGALIVIAIFGVTPALVLRAMRARGMQRWSLIQEWVVLDRRPEARALPPGDIPGSLAMAYDLERSGAPPTSAVESTEVPDVYGVSAYPHGRGITGAAICMVGVVLVIAIPVAAGDLADSGLIGLLLLFTVVTVAAWCVTATYIKRHRWCLTERLVRGRERRRWQQRSQLAAGQPPTSTVQGLHPALLYALLLAPTVIVTLIYFTARPRMAAGFGVIASIAVAILILGLPIVIIKRQRERQAMASAADRLATAFDGATGGVRPVRYGLNDASLSGAGTADWDHGPSRTGAVVVTSGTLQLRGTDGSALDLPLTELIGAVVIPSGVAWLTGSVDLLLHSGEAIELRTPEPRAFAEELAQSGVRVLG
ncbi:hypothetical protein [Streptomyces sp. 7N604]|uniref:hypothetical protein n=1 Tax=Streptomyces sp. 7N604 TaxID=3457415 RepID=UPI003FD17FF1